MTNIYPNLAEKMLKTDTSVSELADYLEINLRSMYRRLSGETEFKVIEVIKICQYFNEFDVVELFVRLDTNRTNEKSQENSDN